MFALAIDICSGENISERSDRPALCHMTPNKVCWFGFQGLKNILGITKTNQF